VTAGALSANTLPMEPSAHSPGIAAGFDRYASQSGSGVAEPTQVICCAAPGKPVFSRAAPMRLVLGVFWKMPMPPRSMARGPRCAPAKPSICGAVPYDHEKPSRGLTYRRSGTRSLRAPKSSSISGFVRGASRKRLPSTRTPYWSCRLALFRQESPKETAPTSCEASRSTGVRRRVNDAGWLASRSASEL